MERIRLKFASGRGLAIHSDAVASLLRAAFGAIRVTRASHVEPVGEDWQADMSPLGGPKLGPFKTRSAALRAEVHWINREKLS